MPEVLLKCPDCHKTYRTRKFDDKRLYFCRRCNGVLEQVSKAETPPPTEGKADAEPAPDDAPDDPLVGQQIGQYQIIEKLGEGGMGAVYKAEHVGLKRPSALKVLPQQKAERSQRSVQRFMREAQSAAALDHPNIVPVFNVGEADGWHFIDMQYVEGESLQDRLAREGALSLKEATDLAIDIARALSSAHGQGIVHRDIKPANVLLSQDGAVKVADFGLAKSVESDDTLITVEGRGGLGTPAFMSPEQCDGLPIDGRSDIYSLGVTYYYLLTGEIPYQTDETGTIAYKHRTAPIPDPRDQVADLPEEACRIISKAMAKDIGGRYSSCDQMIEELQALLGEKTADSRPVREALGTAATRGRRLLWPWPLKLLSVLWRGALSLCKRLRLLTQSKRARVVGAIAVAAIVVVFGTLSVLRMIDPDLSRKRREFTENGVMPADAYASFQLLFEDDFDNSDLANWKGGARDQRVSDGVAEFYDDDHGAFILVEQVPTENVVVEWRGVAHQNGFCAGVGPYNCALGGWSNTASSDMTGIVHRGRVYEPGKFHIWPIERIGAEWATMVNGRVIYKLERPRKNEGEPLGTLRLSTYHGRLQIDWIRVWHVPTVQQRLYTGAKHLVTEYLLAWSTAAYTLAALACPVLAIVLLRHRRRIPWPHVAAAVIAVSAGMGIWYLVTWPPSLTPEMLEDCVLYLPFDEGTVTNKDGKRVAEDLSGSEYHGTTAGPKLVEGKADLALEFDGKDDYVDLPSGALALQKPMSISLWLRVNGEATGLPLCKAEESGYYIA